MSNAAWMEPMKLIITAISVAMLCSSQSALALSVNDNMGAWRRASESTKAQVCSLIMKKINMRSVRARDLCTCITATAGDRDLDNLKISEVAAMCAVLIDQ